MFLKFLVTAVVVVVAWVLVTRLTGPRRRRGRGSDRTNQPAVRQPAQQLVKCAGCGIYLPADQTCSCADRA